MISSLGKGINRAETQTSEPRHKFMNTDKFDKHAKNNLAFYEGFLNFSKYIVVAIIITLALMAYFLV